jgi:S1-C subfamily serine protease
MGRSARFTVSLGVIPDYSFSGSGMKIEGVSAGKLAEQIGLKAGDVLIKLGNQSLVDVNSYMQALSQFKKGEQTKLVVLRGKEELVFDITF